MKPKRDPYEAVTHSIIDALSRGTAPWVRPWSTTEGSDRNGETGRPYNGINVILTMWASLVFGFTSNEWFTFNQVRKLGGHVKKGSVGTMLVLFKPREIRVEDPDTGEWKVKKVPLIREFFVFNRDQCADLPDPKPIPGLDEGERDGKIEEWLKSLDAHVVSKRNSKVACYNPFTDTIEMPPFKSFADRGAYYSTRFHEQVHWTGHQSRCDRDLMTSFGSEAYAFEELVAELGSAFLCSEFRVDGTLQHPEYIATWIKRLQEDKKLIFSSASKARTAVEFMMGSHNAANFDEEEAA